MRKLEVKQNTWGSKVTFFLKSTNLIFDLSSFNVYVRMRSKTSDIAIFQAPCTIVQPPQYGEVFYVWQKNDTQVPGDYEMELMVASTDGVINKTLNECLQVRILPTSSISGWNPLTNLTTSTNVAAVGGAQVTATPIVSQLNTITTATLTIATGLALPVVQSGAYVRLVNISGVSLLIYPANDSSGTQINALGANNPFTLTSGTQAAPTIAEFTSDGSFQWYGKIL